MKIADAMLIGGGMAYTFLKAQGLRDRQISGGSTTRSIWPRNPRRRQAEELQVCCCPADHVIAPEFKADAPANTVDRYRDCPRIRWVSTSARRPLRHTPRKSPKPKPSSGMGPMGVFEMPAFAKGTLEIAKAVAAATAAGATSIVGGGDSVAAVHQCRCWQTNFSHFDRRRSFAGVSRRHASYRAWRPLPTNEHQQNVAA